MTGPATTSALRVVLSGQETAGLHALRLLREAGCEIVAVLSDPEPGGRDLAAAARESQIRLRPARDVRSADLATDLRRARVDMLLNVHSLHIVDAAVLDAPRLGSYNLHPGPLPDYAGLHAPSWAILHGRRSHAVTLHRMAAGIDTGPIAFTSEVEITDADNGATLGGRCARAGLALVGQLVERLQSGEAVPSIPQDPNRRRYFGRRRAEDNVVNWAAPARSIVDLVRACDYHPWPSPWGAATATTPDGRTLEILRAVRTGVPSDAVPGEVGATGPAGVDIAALDEWVTVGRLRADGRRVDPGSVLRPGDRLGAAAPTMTGTGCPR